MRQINILKFPSRGAGWPDKARTAVGTRLVVAGAMENEWTFDVLRFWFEETRPEAWFRKDAALDDTIRRRFLGLHRALKAESVETLNANAHNALAAIIVFDQFSRNMFRETGEAFAADAQALRLAEAAIAARFDAQLDLHGRQFLYMPFMHSEDRGVQERSIALFASLGDADVLAFAKGHKDIIDRFGRFPLRNAALSRPSSSEEIEFLKTAPSIG